MARDQDDRHRYGQHYTPELVARVLAAFAIRRPEDVVFDPACGDGRLLREALLRKERLRPEDRGGKLSGRIYGIDRSSQAVEKAGRDGVVVGCGDFFDVGPGSRIGQNLVLPPGFDAIIGNPPYIRQEIIGSADKRRIEERLAADRHVVSEAVWPEFSRRSDIYVYFFAHSIRFLRRGGRLVFLTAGSWLDVAYGAALRRFVLDNFRIIAILESSAESFFSDASIGTAITVLEREPDHHARQTNVVRFVQLTRPLAVVLADVEPERPGRAFDGAAEFARLVEQCIEVRTRDTYRIRAVSQAALAAEAGSTGAPPGWGRYLRADDVFFRILERGNQQVRRLGELARVRFGVKTGANEFFYLQVAERGEGKAKSRRQEEKGLRALSELAAVRRGITTGANEFFYLLAVGVASDQADAGTRRRGGAETNGRADPGGDLLLVEDWAGRRRPIERRYLTPVIFSLKEIDGILLDGGRSRKLFFNCSELPGDLNGAAALDYIRAGEHAGYHLRPTCAARNPWYSIARGMRPAPLIFPSKVGERWLVALNRAQLFEDKKLYGVFPGRSVPPLLLAALLNSTWARYCAEVTCRQMTGAQAIADIDVVTAEGILLPAPDSVDAGLKNKLERALLALAHRPVFGVFEEVNRGDRRILDGLVLEAIGFASGPERGAVLDELYAAVTALVRARLSKSSAFIAG